MLPAIQTTSSALDDGAFDAVTLVLLVAFVVSMVALSVVLARRERDSPSDELLVEKPETTPLVTPPTTNVKPLRAIPPTPMKSSTSPAWLTGVVFPMPSNGLSDAVLLIERLLAARRNTELAAGIALYTPAFRARLAIELGVTEDGLEDALNGATIEGDVPDLRSVELVSGAGDTMSVRAGYANRSSEVYRLIRIEGHWSIDSIERG